MCMLKFRILKPYVCFTLEILRSAINEGISVTGGLERKSHSQDCHLLGRQSNSHNQVSPQTGAPGGQ